jgi:hypothetical protein
MNMHLAIIVVDRLLARRKKRARLLYRKAPHERTPREQHLSKMATAQRVSDVMAHLGAIKPLGDQTNAAAAAPSFSFSKTSAATGAAVVAPAANHFQVRTATASSALPLPPPLLLPLGLTWHTRSSRSR